MEESRREDEDRALAMASISLVRALVDELEAKAVLDAGGVQSVFERALASLEFRHQDGATKLARRIVEGHTISRAPPQDG